MQKKVFVISLGGSLIVPEKMDSRFLLKFVKTLKKFYRSHKFVVVCGGGTIARKYIQTLREEGRSRNELAQAGIMATRMNAQFVMQLFGNSANKTLPMNMKDVKDSLKKNDIVICGALRFAPNSTSDGTAAKLAHFLKAECFMNMTNVPGLYTDNPKKNPKAKFISHITWKSFEKMALAIKFKPGQNFVLDQQAATLIRKHRIKTYIISGDMKNVRNFLKERKFTGTTIEN